MANAGLGAGLQTLGEGLFQLGLQGLQNERQDKILAEKRAAREEEAAAQNFFKSASIALEAGADPQSVLDSANKRFGENFELAKVENDERGIPFRMIMTKINPDGTKSAGIFEVPTGEFEVLPEGDVFGSLSGREGATFKAAPIPQPEVADQVISPKEISDIKGKVSAAQVRLARLRRGEQDPLLTAFIQTNPNLSEERKKVILDSLNKGDTKEAEDAIKEEIEALNARLPQDQGAVRTTADLFEGLD